MFHNDNGTTRRNSSSVASQTLPKAAVMLVVVATAARCALAECFSTEHEVPGVCCVSELVVADVSRSANSGRIDDNGR